MRLSRNQEIKVGSKLQKVRLANGYTQNISFCGYINLNDEYKSIIDNNINYLNQLQNDKK